MLKHKLFCKSKHKNRLVGNKTGAIVLFESIDVSDLSLAQRVHTIYCTVQGLDVQTNKYVHTNGN